MTKRRKYIISSAIAVLCMLGIIAILVLIMQHQKNSLSNLPASFEQQWALRNHGQAIEGIKGRSEVDLNILKAWEITKGSPEVLVGILDTGLQIESPALSASIYKTPLKSKMGATTTRTVISTTSMAGISSAAAHLFLTAISTTITAPILRASLRPPMRRVPLWPALRPA